MSTRRIAGSGCGCYPFARIGAALGMAVAREGGKRHAVPCHHNLQEHLTAYLDGIRVRDDPEGPLFRTIILSDFAYGIRIRKMQPSTSSEQFRIRLLYPMFLLSQVLGLPTAPHALAGAM